MFLNISLYVKITKSFDEDIEHLKNARSEYVDQFIGLESKITKAIEKLKENF